MATLGSFKKFTDGLQTQDAKMPVLFIGHGSLINFKSTLKLRYVVKALLQLRKFANFASL
jgi:hypothetical protein